MSLRKGHLRSKMWAPPAYADDWRDEAKCAGMMNDMIPATVCVGCPVKEPCGLLFDEMDVMLMGEGKRYDQRMVGTYGGIEHPHQEDHPALGNMGGGRYPKGVQPINGGTCTDDECDDGAYRRGMCSKHYQRWLRAKRKADA